MFLYVPVGGKSGAKSATYCATASLCVRCMRSPTNSLNSQKASNPTAALATWSSQKVGVGSVE